MSEILLGYSKMFARWYLMQDVDKACSIVTIFAVGKGK